ECLRRLSGISGQDKAQSLRFSPSIPQPLRAILDQRNEALEAPAEDVESGRHDLRRALVALEGVSEVKEHFIRGPEVAFGILRRNTQRLKDAGLLGAFLLRVGLGLGETSEAGLKILNSNVGQVSGICQLGEFLRREDRPLSRLRQLIHLVDGVL